MSQKWTLLHWLIGFIDYQGPGESRWAFTSTYGQEFERWAEIHFRQWERICLQEAARGELLEIFRGLQQQIYEVPDEHELKAHPVAVSVRRQTKILDRIVTPNFVLTRRSQIGFNIQREQIWLEIEQGGIPNSVIEIVNFQPMVLRPLCGEALSTLRKVWELMEERVAISLFMMYFEDKVSLDRITEEAKILCWQGIPRLRKIMGSFSASDPRLGPDLHVSVGVLDTGTLPQPIEIVHGSVERELGIPALWINRQRITPEPHTARQAKSVAQHYWGNSWYEVGPGQPELPPNAVLFSTTVSRRSSPTQVEHRNMMGYGQSVSRVSSIARLSHSEG